MKEKYVIKLSDDCWLTDGPGDPPRTCREGYAKVFPSKPSALRSLAYYIEKNSHRDSSEWKLVVA